MSDWSDRVIVMMKDFADKYSIVYNKSERELSASFEIGCFLSLVTYYENSGCTTTLENLIENGFKYLTTPNGNPDNFSFLSMEKDEIRFELRQQVRIISAHIDSDIAFTPDIVVLRSDSAIQGIKDNDYAKGKRRFFCVDSSSVIAAHECKSLEPFPELLVSFLGLVSTAHSWLSNITDNSIVCDSGLHLAPTLFVGGSARALHLRMVSSMKTKFPINIVLGMHSGTWDLFGEKAKLNHLNV